MIHELEKLIREFDHGDASRDTFDDILIAEILWLAQTSSAYKQAKQDKSPSEFSSWLKRWLEQIKKSKQTTLPTDLQKPDSKITTKTIPTDTAPLTLEERTSKTAHKITVPQKRDFFITKALIEALAPLKKPSPSMAKGTELDEEETVAYWAKTHILKPHFKAQPENHFDLLLIIDSSRSMALWQESIEQFIAKLHIADYFRTIKLFYLDSEDLKAPLYSNKSKTNPCTFNPSNPDDRNLLFVLSDCIAPAWRNGTMLSTMCGYGTKVPTALINLLPKRMWSGTILANTNLTTLHNPAKSWHHHKITSPLDEQYEQEKGYRVPIVNLEADDFRDLSRFLLGKKANRCSGMIASEEEIGYKLPQVDENLSAHERVDRFFHHSSSLAHELALYLSITTHLNVEIMKMIQHNMLPHSKQIHLAEVFVGGLLDKKRDAKFYHFITDEQGISVREILLDRLGDYRAMATLRKNSEFIARHLGSSLDFTALLHSNLSDAEGWSEADRAFAHIARSVLMKIGGNYAKIATTITHGLGGEPDKPKPPEHGDEESAIVIPTSKRFQMGSDEYDREQPIHEVVFNYDFEIAAYPVTFEEYDLYCEAKGIEKPSDNGWGRGRRPVTNVSWYDAVDYCKWLSEATNEHYRLPSEAEWEYGCRAGTVTKWYFGDDEKELKEYAWYDKNSYDLGSEHKDYGTHPVGEKLPNPWGLYDMHGNVWEWCADDYVDTYKETPRDGAVHKDKDSGEKILRGGSWNNVAINTRSSNRGRDGPGGRDDDVGFRLLRTLP
jgi:formylglycine-generating enzyme required for sulfatase activity